jgi:exosome complex component MTR3
MPLSNCAVPEIIDLSIDLTSTDVKGKSQQSSERDDSSGELGVVAGASGSARWQMGETDVVCAIYGPRAPQRSTAVDDKARLECEFRYAPFLNKPQNTTGVNPNDTMASDSLTLEKYLSGIVIESLQGSLFLDNYPKMVISIVINVMATSGQIGLDVSSAITCASLALADASIEMHDLVSACTVCLDKAGGGSVYAASDSDNRANGDAASSQPVGTMSVMSMQSKGKVCNMLFEGRAPGPDLAALLRRGVLGGGRVRGMMEAVLGEGR